jgi:peroxiredoxin
VTQTLTVPDIGAVMPDLAVVDGSGHPATLSAVQGERAAVVFFLRAAGCPICVRHARSLAAMGEAGQLGDRSVILVAPGGPGESRELAERVPSRRVSTWASGEAHAAAGLGSFLTVQHSGTFLLSAAGAVDYRRTSLLPVGSFSAKELLEAVSR